MRRRVIRTLLWCDLDATERLAARQRAEVEGVALWHGGDVAGDHKVIFAADGERIELSHKAGSRQIFARGAVQAALWARSKNKGLYSMLDVLNINGE